MYFIARYSKSFDAAGTATYGFAVHHASPYVMLEGFDVLDEIASVETTSPETWNHPLVMPIIASIRVTSDAPLPPVQRIP